MVKSFNINLVIILTALITTIGTAPVWDDDAIMKVTRKMHQSATDIVNHRKRDVRTSSLARILENQYIIGHIAGVVSKSIPSFTPFSKEQLFQELYASTPITQILFTRAYHSLVFERLMTLFLKIEHHATKQQILKKIKPQDSEILKNGLDSVAAHLLWFFDLEGKCQDLFTKLSGDHYMDPRVFSRFRRLVLPEYDWAYVRLNLLPALKQLAQGQLQIHNDVTTVEMLEDLWKRAENVIDGRRQETLIVQIRSDSRPSTFTEAQLLEVPEATIPLDRLHLIRAYHHLVVETLENLVLMIKEHFVKPQYKEKLGRALAEVVSAKTLHQNLRSKYEIIIQRIHDEWVNWQDNVNLPAYELAPVDSMQCLTDGQYSAYNYDSIFDYGLGYGLEASTSQPGPQPGYSDFLAEAYMSREATPELAPRFGYSHDDRYPLWDDRFSNELHRPPSEHGGFVGGSSMNPGPSTDNIRRAGDSSQYGHCQRQF
ncbi:hypothetical protein SeLEV6574_g04994 [Synchytrium endobioticum]|uniref:Uncharacterized protein n=1 Tax=Synchytrium endobioticum TaxID=286115 RepID=A0A507CWI2_9FUNG|nr:hypothetical protein SeLEV6574_g04994 [Synchytrium endobioticum]